MIYAFDLDGTLCTKTNGHYKEAKPLIERINKVNQLYELGYHIVIYTSRGATTGIDWRSITENQLRDWGVKYHDLRLDKIEYDIFVDDKAIDDISFFKHNKGLPIYISHENGEIETLIVNGSY